MPKEMTASELHELVNGPYKMPDGSTRRALWERVPALQPTYGSGEYDLCFVKVSWRWVRQPLMQEIPYEPLRSDHVDDHGAAALIRVGVEDWLFECDRWECPTHTTDGGWSTFVHGWADCTDSRESVPTVLHLYVLMAHTEADALGVPH